MSTLLNIGAGSIDLMNYKYHDDKVVHLDASYRGKDEGGVAVDPCDVEHMFLYDYPSSNLILCKSDVFDFVERFPFKFDGVIAERIFEHMEYVNGSIGRLLEGLNRITTPSATLSIVVPNMILVSKMLLAYEDNTDQLDHTAQLNYKLIINTEYTNMKADSHASVWTPKLAHEYIESEGTWKISELDEQIMFANRNIYMRIKCVKP